MNNYDYMNSLDYYTSKSAEELAKDTNKVKKQTRVIVAAMVIGLVAVIAWYIVSTPSTTTATKKDSMATRINHTAQELGVSTEDVAETYSYYYGYTPVR